MNYLAVSALSGLIEARRTEPHAYVRNLLTEEIARIVEKLLPDILRLEPDDPLQVILQQLEKRDTETAQIREELAALKQRRGWLARLLGGS